MPALAEGHEGEEPVVLAGVGCFVAARTEKVRKRIDGEGVVPEECSAQAEAPEEERETAVKASRQTPKFGTIFETYGA